MAAAVMALGLAAGIAGGAYAEEWKEGGDQITGTYVSGKQQGPMRVTFEEDGSVVVQFVCDNKAEGASVQYGGENGEYSVAMVSGNKLNGMYLAIQKNGAQKATFWEDGELKKNIALKSWTTSDNTHYYAREKTDIEAGKAIAVYTSGNIYMGDFKNGRRDGWGTYFWKDAEYCYMGEWKDGLKDGVGYMIYPGDSDYLYKSAVWTNDKCQDVVFYYTKDDDIHLVPNKDSKEEGPAAVIGADGTIRLLEYKDGKVSNTKPDIYKDKDGNQYIGTDGKKGYGLKVTKTAGIEIGNFKNGNLDGQGFAYSGRADLKRDEGTYKEGKLMEGVSIWPNGTYYKGTYDYSGTYMDNLLEPFGKGFLRTFQYSMEGTFSGYRRLDTGIYTIFMKDGSSVEELFIDGKLKK